MTRGNEDLCGMRPTLPLKKFLVMNVIPNPFGVDGAHFCNCVPL